MPPFRVSCSSLFRCSTRLDEFGNCGGACRKGYKGFYCLEKELIEPIEVVVIKQGSSPVTKSLLAAKGDHALNVALRKLVTCSTKPASALITDGERGEGLLLSMTCVRLVVHFGDSYYVHFVTVHQGKVPEDPVGEWNSYSAVLSSDSLAAQPCGTHAKQKAEGDSDGFRINCLGWPGRYYSALEVVYEENYQYALTEIEATSLGLGSPESNAMFHRGCFSEVESTAYELDLSLESCGHFCSGYLYAAVKGFECHCADRLNEETELRNCNFKCPKNPDLYCGGRAAFTAYLVNAQLPHYHGCFQDLQLFKKEGKCHLRPMTIVNCLRCCEEAGKRFSFIMLGEACGCSQVEPESQDEERNCNVPCTNDWNNYCGGNDSFAVYSAWFANQVVKSSTIFVCGGTSRDVFGRCKNGCSAGYLGDYCLQRESAKRQMELEVPTKNTKPTTAVVKAPKAVTRVSAVTVKAPTAITEVSTVTVRAPTAITEVSTVVSTGTLTVVTKLPTAGSTRIGLNETTTSAYGSQNFSSLKTEKRQRRDVIEPVPMPFSIYEGKSTIDSLANDSMSNDSLTNDSMSNDSSTKAREVFSKFSARQLTTRSDEIAIADILKSLVHLGFTREAERECPPSGRCSCEDGFRWNQFGGTCEDVDECETLSCEKCTNLRGGFTCLCGPHFVNDEIGDCVGTERMKNAARGIEVQCRGGLRHEFATDGLYEPAPEQLSALCDMQVVELERPLEVHYVVVYRTQEKAHKSSIDEYRASTVAEDESDLGCGTYGRYVGMDVAGVSLGQRINCALWPEKLSKTVIFIIPMSYLVTEVEVFSLGPRVPGSHGFLYRGCYDIFVQREESKTGQSLLSCLKYCSSSLFAAIKGDFCFCLPSERGPEVKEEECNHGCANYPANSCGGISAFSIYMVKIKLPRYLGCFEDALPCTEQDCIERDNMTLAMCLRFCNLHPYASLQNGSTCRCSDEIHSPVDERQECNISCPGKPTSICGGTTHKTFYSTCYTSGKMGCAELAECEGDVDEFGRCPKACRNDFVMPHCLGKKKTMSNDLCQFENPCRDVPHSECTVKGDEFVCVCSGGYVETEHGCTALIAPISAIGHRLSFVSLHDHETTVCALVVAGWQLIPRGV